MTSHLRSQSRMSNTGYHQNGKPNWWARVGSGVDAKFLRLPSVRGDYQLDCIVDVEPGTVVHIGAGRGGHKTIRETATTRTMAAPAVRWDVVE